MLNAFLRYVLRQPPLQERGLLELPAMGFGTFIGIEEKRIANKRTRNKVTTDAIYNALSLGYRHLDLAEAYDNLYAVKQALQRAFKPKTKGGLGLKREDIWLTMKADIPFDKAHIDKLLIAVGVEYFDLFLLHHPTQGETFQSDETLVKVWQDLTDIDKSKIKRVGVSNCYEPHLSRLLAICDRDNLPKPYANEFELNLLAKNKCLVEYCQHHNIKMIAYSPLGYSVSSHLLANTQLGKVAQKLGATPAQAALAWLMSKGIAVIPKSRHKDRMKENYTALDLVDRFKANPRLSAALDSVPDLSEEGLSGTAIDSKEFGNHLEWQVSRKRTWRIC